MNVIFLDIDGVLNSWKYDHLYKTASDGNIDETRLPLLKRLVESSDAKIVLSSSWRKHWSRDRSRCDSIGIALEETFSKHQLSIFDKTPTLPSNDRAEEIKLWLDQNKAFSNFVIIDDIRFGWSGLEEHVVNTNDRIGRGLEETHVLKALRILNGTKHQKK